LDGVGEKVIEIWAILGHPQTNRETAINPNLHPVRIEIRIEI